MIRVIENQQLSEANPVTGKSDFPQVKKWIYDKFWMVLLKVPHIYFLQEDKLKHGKAIAVMEFIWKKTKESSYTDYIDYADLLFLAVENDNHVVVERIIQTFPQSSWSLKDKKYTIYQLSIMNRSENVYNFFVDDINHRERMNPSVTYRRGESNLLHLAGKLAPQEKLNMVTGAALQMQRELQWFQEVRKLVTTNESEDRNTENETPIMVFMKEHEGLRQKGEDWMKNTANSYTITAALIITIVFAAAITVPGGNDGGTGKAIYKSKLSFKIFMIADAISLFTSTTSLLLFLSILTARYAVDDFLRKLPKRLIFGLVMLFVSVTTMLIAFGATLYIMAGEENTRILILIALITCLPVATFVMLQLPLLDDLISSTYGRGIFGKRKKLA